MTCVETAMLRNSYGKYYFLGHVPVTNPSIGEASVSGVAMGSRADQDGASIIAVAGRIKFIWVADH